MVAGGIGTVRPQLAIKKPHVVKAGAHLVVLGEFLLRDIPRFPPVSSKGFYSKRATSISRRGLWSVNKQKQC